MLVPLLGGGDGNEADICNGGAECACIQYGFVPPNKFKNRKNLIEAKSKGKKIFPVNF
jgi:hypothetical protein